MIVVSIRLSYGGPHGIYVFAWLASSTEPPWTFVVAGVEQVRGKFDARHALSLPISISEARMERLIAHPFLGTFLAEMLTQVGHKIFLGGPRRRD